MNPIVGLALLLGSCFPAIAELIALEGEHFDPGQIPLEWKATIDRTNLWVYKVISQNFTTAVITNAMSIGRFRSLDIVNASEKKRLRFQDRKRQETRYLEIVPDSGYIQYYDTKGTDMMSPVQGVPDAEEVDRLGFELLYKLGIDRTQIVPKPWPKGEATRSRIAPSGEAQNIEVHARHITFTRQIDGIYFLGLGSRGGLWIEYGNNAKITQFELVWPNLIPQELQMVASRNEMLEFIKCGRAVYSAESARLVGARKFTIKSLTPCYWGPFKTDPQDMVYPLASIKVEASFETNKLEFELVCPVLSTNTVISDARF